MYSAKTNKILIVDDDDDLLFLLETLLTSDGFEVTQAKNGKEAMEKIDSDLPHLVIMDLLMPEMSGDVLVDQLKNDLVASHIPVIMLTGKKDYQTKIKSLQNGVDDFMIKPFKNDELLAKIHSVLYRTYRGLDANPLTRLPGNNTIRQRMEELIHKKSAFAVCFIDIDNFKAFNDKYGFETGDIALELTAQTIIEVIKKRKNKSDFIGHIGGDDFIVITQPSEIHDVCQEIISNFDKAIISLYNEEDRKQGYIISQSRQGKIEKFPVMTLSIGVVTNEKKKVVHSVQISEIGTELKKYAKLSRKSNYVVDERTSNDDINSNNISNIKFEDLNLFRNC